MQETGAFRGLRSGERVEDALQTIRLGHSVADLLIIYFSQGLFLGILSVSLSCEGPWYLE